MIRLFIIFFFVFLLFGCQFNDTEKIIEYDKISFFQMENNKKGKLQTEYGPMFIFQIFPAKELKKEKSDVLEKEIQSREWINEYKEK